ncbi:ABC1 family protein C21C3.03, mitochondrial [Seminavis robusta]|uniref:ABC1 family protein C21C3.03, mitochondrial n=1 Tax=Seminavis robusta TaxID=568900 RepID=A0A9N8EAA9_9STRA|nr:ABC1 family protein C21C3.03, mitochondrial [Seminavis robusta]|eukprot:Sro834_g208720.1 ABC1 family protein C21C3.03, mitochondrial (628) ;mRNA; r:27146-29029
MISLRHMRRVRYRSSRVSWQSGTNNSKGTLTTFVSRQYATTPIPRRISLAALRRQGLKRSNRHYHDASLSVIPLRYLRILVSNHGTPLLLEVIAPHSTREDDDNTPRILAFSAALKEEGLLSRIIQWCHDFIHSLWEAIQVVLRVSGIAIRMSPLMILSPAAYLTSQVTQNDNNAVSELAWSYFMHVVQHLGPGYVKLCQWVATRRDIFPKVVCDRLSRLHDKGYPHSLQESERILRQAFGDDYDTKLHLERVIGCGSAAQVYQATLMNNNSNNNNHDGSTSSPVAVKILHPGFSRLIEKDLWLLDTVSKWLHEWAPEGSPIQMMNLPRAVQNFGDNLRRQADLTLEGDNLIQFRRNFYGQDEEEGQASSAIFFPQPKPGWVTSNVLVEDLVENATPIAEFLQDNTELGLQTRKDLAGPLLRAFLKMVFQDNFVHSDIHPGNVLIQTTTTEAADNHNLLERLWHQFRKTEADDATTPTTVTKRTIVFLDAGIVTSLDDNDRRNLKDLFRAVILNEGYEAGRLMVERAKYERCSQTEGGVEAFATGVGDIVAEFHDRRKSGLTLGAVRIGSLLGQVLDLCRVHGVEIDPSMASIVISTLVLEGLGRSLEPTLNLMDCAIPFVLGRGKV